MGEEFKKGKLILINKPYKWTSFQVVNKLRWSIKNQFGIKKLKVGHAGTLDPLATGLLIICTGKMTKKINSFQSLNKTYTGCLTLGATTPSYDLETKIDKVFNTKHINQKLLLVTSNNFIGNIMQKPPIFSAIKKDGKRLYESARKGINIEINSREVQIEKFEITKIDIPEITFKVVCSKGTYIRSLAHDYGKELKSGAFLSSLQREKIGDYSIQNSMTIEEFLKTIN